MPLQKQTVNINFAKGLDTKTDPFQVSPGNFLALNNTVFSKGGLLQKRNGFSELTPLPTGTNATYLTTFNGNLTAVGDTLNAYSQGSGAWIQKANLNPLSLNTLPLIRNNLNQSYADSAIALNSIICTVYAEYNGSSTVYKYVVSDGITGQNILPPTLIPSVGTVTYTPRVFLLGSYFIIMYDDLVSGVNYLTYVTVSTSNPHAAGTPVQVSATYAAASTGTFDGVVANNTLYFAWPSLQAGGQIRVSGINSTLGQINTYTSTVGYTATNVSIAADTSGSTPVIYVTTFDSGTNVAHTFALNQILNATPVLAATVIPLESGTLKNITSSATDGVCTIIAEELAEYSYDNVIHTDYIVQNTVTQSGTVGTASTVVRSLGLASKAFLYNETIYFLGIYGGPQGQVNFQPTYFLMNLSGQVISRFAYENGPPYYVTGLPTVSIVNNVAQVPYLYKDLIQAVNKNTNIPVGSQTAGIYSQTGINLATFTFGTDTLLSSEIGSNLNLTGGYVTAYDGYSATEQNFFLYPDYIEATWSTTGGSVAAQPDGATNTSAYYYQVTYEWTDNQGNAMKSAPSIPIAVTTTGSGTTGSITVNVPTLRLTYKTANPVKIVIYRWSVAQQVYYQVTSITQPLLNNTTVDEVSYVDTSSDATILGNNILYTTGSVVENIGPPATDIMTLFQSRLFLVDSEDRNLLWFSKQVIEATPVEMSDLFTIYVAPTTSAQGSTGPITALSVMDDKLVIFKKDAIYYINGVGPDNTGSNNQFSEPVLITATVGCAVPKSIVFMPNGLMFQSDKGIWLLGRDLSSSYIGAPVEAFNSQVVVGALNIPGTNQVRFNLENNSVLMYDYYYNQWGTFINVPAISSVLYQSLHTYIDTFGRVFQESVGKYVDGSAPVLMSFTTGWMSLAGLQGFERTYFFYLLGQYISPHKLNVQISYDFAQSPAQTVLIQPDNFTPTWGGDTLYGGSPSWGGQPSLEQWRVFMSQQKCQSFQITIQEIYDGTLGVAPGGGLTLSGLDLVVGLKKGYTTIRAARSIG